MMVNKIQFCCIDNHYKSSFEFMNSGSGLQDIDDVFAESNTYQPKVPSHDEEIVVRKCLIQIT